jgi:PAS domain S-box-containing protein
LKCYKNEIQGIFASARDIHEQSRLQNQLAEERAYNRSLIEASADALFAIAPDGIVTDINEEAIHLTGYSKRHLINSKFSEYFTDSKLADNGIKLSLREGRVIGYELILITRNGRKIVVSLNVGVFTDASGNPQGILAAARDISQQRYLEQQLRDQQAYTRSLIESNIDALMTTDALGIITDVNKQMEGLTGITREKLMGSPFKKYFTDKAEDAIREVLYKGKVTNYELTAKNKFGEETVVSYNATTFNNRDGKLQGVFAAARDITERKQFEEKLKVKNLELKDANLAKDRFLASMSHELRTPLNAIIGFTGTLLMRLPGPLTDNQHKQLVTIESSSKHLLSLINDLLDLAKVESGKIELNFEKVDCQKVLDDVFITLKPLADKKGINFNVKISPDLENITLSTDRRSLTQILINLTNNAIKFTDKGYITILLNSNEEIPKSYRFNVFDTGIGISIEDKEKLFNAYKQVGTHSNKYKEGTGLGLHLSQKLAQLLGSKIDFVSKIGEGSHFWLDIPEGNLEQLKERENT